MPRYRFNVHDGHTIPDPVGQELPDLDAAKSAAVTLAGRLIGEMGGAFWHGEEWQMDVTDDAGLILFTLTFVGLTAAAGRPAAGLTG